MPIDSETLTAITHLGAGGVLLVAIVLFLGFQLRVIERFGKHLDKLGEAIERNTESNRELRATVIEAVARKG